jgi:hypothetical protein
MALPTGTISISQVNTELGRGATVSISLNETAVRSLAGVASGTISMNNLRGKTFAPTISISPDPLQTTIGGGGSVTSGAATATASGGAGGYTYAWAYVSGDSFTINSSTSASTTFTTTLVSGGYKLGNYRCTVTSGGATAFADIQVIFESLGL